MLLISTSSLKWYWLHKIFKIASQSWYDWINLDLSSLDFDTENTDYIKELIKEFGIRVVWITAYERKMDKNSVDFILKMATDLWVKSITFYPPYRLDKDTTWFSTYLPKIKSRNPDISINVMNTEPKTFLFFIPEYKDATLSTIKKITGETTLVVSNVDSSSWIDLLKTFSLLWNSIRNVFLGDKTWNKQDIMLWKWDMPLESLLIKLKEAGYKWLFTMKINPKELSAWDDNAVLQKLAEAKLYFEKYFK
ncbi:MAG: hypothetical protein ACD_49C00060G0057 [uncultured bacterium (gcode 4)]|uniref:Xylose isomerase-like TIM barrel domain-containing protein n=1 Tax=uncultured bacterium (gcode 4) TaxID=1234023 RepID=K2ADU9_9BACT|nr:MAG: hypothetical protein ACD_49C00060G0057 [uncultured bacterium (gcode 4)]